MSELILAKSSGESLIAHTTWCLNVGRVLLELLPLSNTERKKLESSVLLAIALHDIGKIATGFQKMLRGEQKDWGGKRHEVLSAALASSIRDIHPSVLMAILTHHKSLPGDGITVSGFGCLPSEQIPWSDYSTPIWEEMVQEWQENQEFFRDVWLQICTALDREDLANYRPDITALALDRSWLSRRSGKGGQRREIPFIERYEACLVRGLTVAADHLGSAHHLPQQIPDIKSFSVLRMEPRPFQLGIGGTEGSAILRAPTGSGKTEAALLWAQRNQRQNGRLFYVLPYTASINAMYRRLGPGVSKSKPGIFGAKNVGLLHSRATAALYTILEATGDDSSQLHRQSIAHILRNLAREMWFPIRICTPHQILRYMLRGKGWETMLAEFPNSCFIFDEIHAYDPRVLGLTLATAKLVSNWGARSLFLSATLPNFLESLIREALGNIPTIVPDATQEKDREILDRKRHFIEIRNGAILENLDKVIDAIDSSSSTLIVCNHPRTAQEVFDRLVSRYGEGACLLHSRFNQEDRNRIERQLIELVLPKVLVATQVVEVSLDVDFDQAFLEPAPIDALVQRMGRVNRAGTNVSPMPIVIYTDQVNQHHLYCECTGKSHISTCRVWRTLEELRSIANPVSENDLVDIANRVYIDGFHDSDEQAFEESLTHPDIYKFEERVLAGAHQDWVEEVIEKADGTIEVLPSGLVKEFQSRLEMGLWIEANSLLVPVRVKSLSSIRRRLNTSGDPWILDCQYSSTTGLTL